MAVTDQGKTSHGGITEYSWTGTTGDNVAQSITSIGGHYEIVQVSLNLVGTGSASLEFTGTIDHSKDSALDIEFYAQNMSGQTGTLQRWANNAGIIVPLGSDADFAWTNTDSLAWGLSVFVRSE